MKLVTAIINPDTLDRVRNAFATPREGYSYGKVAGFFGCCQLEWRRPLLEWGGTYFIRLRRRSTSARYLSYESGGGDDVRARHYRCEFC